MSKNSLVNKEIENKHLFDVKNFTWKKNLNVKKEDSKVNNLKILSRKQIMSIGVIHGVILGILQASIYLGTLPFQDAGTYVIFLILICSPIGIYIANLNYSIIISLISILVWFFSAIVVLSLPIFFISSIPASGYIIGYMTTLFQYFIFIPLGVFIGTVLPSIISELNN